MTTRTRSLRETAEWAVASPRVAALVSPRAVARALRRLEDALSVLDLAGRVGARTAGTVRALHRAD